VGRFRVSGEEMGGQVGHESDGTGLGVGSEPVPDLGGRDLRDGKRLLVAHKNTSPIDTSDGGSVGMILSRSGQVRRGEVGVVGRVATLASDAIEEKASLTEAVKIEEVIRPGRGLALGRRGIVRAAHGDGGMVAVRESDDEIGIEASADLDDLELLSAERVMGMGDGDESRRGLGEGGSVLGAFLPSAIGSHKRRSGWPWNLVSASRARNFSEFRRDSNADTKSLYVIISIYFMYIINIICVFVVKV
jgi:hypothetical protein